MGDRTLQIGEIENRAAVHLKSWVSKPRTGSFVPPDLKGHLSVLTFSPREWIVVSDRVKGGELREHLVRHLDGDGIAVVDLSSGLKALRLEGPESREVLSKGCGLDLHPRVFPPGRCTRTRLAQLAVILDCNSSAPRFDLYVGRSYFSWLHAWLKDAAAEFR
jgi:sarcosine oxidase subunit gamma